MHGNLKLIVPKVQKDIVRVVASETTKVILDDPIYLLFWLMNVKIS